MDLDKCHMFFIYDIYQKKNIKIIMYNKHMELYYTLLEYLNNHDTLRAGDFNYVLEEVKHDVKVAFYCFLITKILQCRRLKVNLNRPNALLHVKDNCPELSETIEEGMNRTSVSQQDDIAIQIVFYFLHIEEYTTTDSKVIEAMLDAYHLKN